MGKYGLLGEKLGHSFSPQIHGMLHCPEYGLYEVRPSELERFLQTTDLDGMNVTIPYKKAVIPFLSGMSERAKKIGCVNTLVRRGGGWFGDNTDYDGFYAMTERCGVPPKGKKALIFGSGGASLTAQTVLRELGAEVVVISRSGENHYGNLERHRDASLLVNATPLGMYPETDAAPVRAADFPNCEAVLDVVYNPARTRLLMEAERLGIPHGNGLRMLAAQALAAEERFLNRTLPREDIGAVTAALAKQTENFILIGMPGCGKTRVGEGIAARLGRPFADSDSVIESRFGKAPADIIRTEGEAAFRRRESEVLAELGKQSGLVIATGGGCVTVPENYPALHCNGKIFWLRRALEKLSTNGRPLSQSMGVEALYAARKERYAAFADGEWMSNEDKEASVEGLLRLWNEAFSH